MAEYTKEDWRVCGEALEHSGRLKEYRFQADVVVGDTAIPIFGKTKTEAETKAHLIAAAPIGYELAGAILDNTSFLEIRALARKFIAKVEGKGE